MRESAEQGVKLANDMATTTTMATESDLLQAGHIVKERWKVGDLIFFPIIFTKQLPAAAVAVDHNCIWWPCLLSSPSLSLSSIDRFCTLSIQPSLTNSNENVEWIEIQTNSDKTTSKDKGDSGGRSQWPQPNSFSPCYFWDITLFGYRIAPFCYRHEYSIFEVWYLRIIFLYVDGDDDDDGGFDSLQ